MFIVTINNLCFCYLYCIISNGICTYNSVCSFTIKNDGFNNISCQSFINQFYGILTVTVQIFQQKVFQVIWILSQLFIFYLFYALFKSFFFKFIQIWHNFSINSVMTVQYKIWNVNEFNTKSEMLMFNTKSEVLIMEKPLFRAVDKKESNLIRVKISNWLLMDD